MLGSGVPKVGAPVAMETAAAKGAKDHGTSWPNQLGQRYSRHRFGKNLSDGARDGDRRHGTGKNKR
jgi:hypothetical protein